MKLPPEKQINRLKLEMKEMGNSANDSNYWNSFTSHMSFFVVSFPRSFWRLCCCFEEEIIKMRITKNMCSIYQSQVFIRHEHTYKTVQTIAFWCDLRWVWQKATTMPTRLSEMASKNWAKMKCHQSKWMHKGLLIIAGFIDIIAHFCLSSETVQFAFIERTTVPMHPSLDFPQTGIQSIFFFSHLFRLCLYRIPNKKLTLFKCLKNAEKNPERW